MASKSIRGITIEIGGDTTKLGKALEDSEKKSRSLQVELREIQNSLKFNPGNVELLTQKQVVLAQSIAETSDKLDTLREAERQVIAQFERGEVAEEQVRALQREILKTENQLDSMSGELNSTNRLLSDLADGTRDAREFTQEYRDALEDSNKELEEFKGKASEAFDTLKTGATVLGTTTLATAGYAVNLSTEFDKAFNTLQTQTGATAEEMENLEESASNIYKSGIGESMEDVAVSMATVKTQTKLSGEELEKVTKTAIVMRDTFGFDVNESVRAVNSMMNQFGITADEAYNLIAQGAQNGLNQNGDLMDVVNEYSTQFADAGYSAEDMFNMLNNGAEAGTWSIDKLGDAIKEYNIRMSDGTASEALTSLGLNADEVARKFGEGGQSAQEANKLVLESLKGVEDEQERYKLGQEIMGTMWEDLGEDAVYALMDTQGEISNTSKALDEINDTKYDDLGSSLSELGRTIETDVVQPLGEELKPVINEVIDEVKANAPQIKEILSTLTSMIGGLITFIVDNADIVIPAIVAIGAGLIAWNVVSMISSVIGVVSTLFTAIKTGVPIMQALNMVMNANPIGIIITAITALVAGFITLWNTSDEFRNFWIELWNSILAFVQPIIDAIVGFFVGAWDTIVSVWTTATEFFSGIAVAIAGFFSSAWNSIVAVWSVVSGFFTSIWNTIVAIFTPAIEWFSALFSSIYNTLASIINVIIGLVRGCWTMIVRIFEVAGSWFYNTVIKPVANFFTGLWDGIKTGARIAWDTIVGVFNAVATWFNNTVIKPVVNTFTGLWNTLKNGASNAWQGIKSVFSGVANFFGDIFGSAWKKVKDIFSTGGQIFSGIKDGIVSAFKTVVNAIIKGINKAVAVPFDFINGVLNKIRNIGFLGIEPFKGLWKQNPISVPQIPLLYRGGILKKGQTGFLEGNGAEAVVPLEKETGWINRIAEKMNESLNNNPSRSNAVLTAKMDEMIRTMKALKSTIVLDTGVLVGETINQIDEQLGHNYSMRERRI